MPTYQLVITNDAELDIAEARQWYQEQSGLGSDFVASIGRQLEFIEFQPFATPAVAHGSAARLLLVSHTIFITPSMASSSIFWLFGTAAAT